ncbi:hypothetical protein GCM10020220_087290 [Nonomuraea rubra]
MCDRGSELPLTYGVQVQRARAPTAARVWNHSEIQVTRPVRATCGDATACLSLSHIGADAEGTELREDDAARAWSATSEAYVMGGPAQILVELLRQASRGARDASAGLAAAPALPGSLERTSRPRHGHVT